MALVVYIKYGSVTVVVQEGLPIAVVGAGTILWRQLVIKKFVSAGGRLKGH